MSVNRHFFSSRGIGFGKHNFLARGTHGCDFWELIVQTLLALEIPVAPDWSACGLFYCLYVINQTPFTDTAQITQVEGKNKTKCNKIEVGGSQV
jgi:hypothetical protein